MTSSPAPAVTGRGDRRGLRVALIAVLLLILAAIGPLHRALTGALAVAGPLLVDHPVAGGILFVALAAAAAMLTFFSSAVLLPAALEAWSPAVCVVLLWIGWIVGGAIAYAIGRFLGRPAARALSASGLGRFEHLVSGASSFGMVLLFQLAVPSEIPGYAFGLARLPFARFFPALAVAELPYAIATGYAGSAFMDRRLVPLAILLTASAALGISAFRVLRRRQRRSDPARSPG